MPNIIIPVVVYLDMTMILHKKIYPSYKILYYKILIVRFCAGIDIDCITVY